MGQRKKNDEPVMADLDMGMSDKAVMKKHGIDATELGRIAFNWREMKKNEETDKKPAKEPKPKPKPKPKKKAGDYYDLTGQVLSRMNANFVVVRKDSGIPVMLFEPMIGIGFIPYSIYARSGPGEKLWINDRAIEDAVVAGLDLNRTGGKIKMLRLDDILSVKIRRMDDDIRMQKELETDSIMMSLDSLGNGLPEFPAGTYWDDDRKLGVDEWEKYNGFFKDTFRIYDNVKSKWRSVPDGKVRMLQYGRFIDNYDIYNAHFIYFNYLNGIARDDIESLAKKEGMYITTKGPSKGLLDPRINVKKGNTQVRIDGVINGLYDQIKTLSVVPGISTEDIRIWMYFRFLIPNFEIIAKHFGPMIKKGGYDDTAEKEDSEVKWFFKIAPWNSFVVPFLKAIYDTDGTMLKTSLLTQCGAWVQQAKEFSDKFI